MRSERAARFSIVAALLFAASCSSSSSSAPVIGPDGMEGTPLKVSLFTFQKEGNARLQPTFYVMLSYGWRSRFGPVSHEQFERITPNVFKNVEVNDVHVATIIKAIKERGWDALPATDVSKIDFDRIKRIIRDGAAPGQNSGPMRWLTISDGETTKTVCNDDALRAGSGMALAYVACERTALVSLTAMTAKISVGADPGTIPQPKR